MPLSSATLIGFAAGIVSVLLFLAMANMSPLAALLVHIAPLPLFVAGLGWGLPSAIIAGALGTVVSGMLIGPQGSAVFAISIALPVCFLIYLTGLFRTSASSPQKAGSVEWYPIGRVVAWAAVSAGLIAAVGVIMLDTNTQDYYGSLTASFEKLLATEFAEFGPLKDLSKEEITRLSSVMARLLPAISAIAWLGITLFNMWLAGRIVRASGPTARPWPDLAALSYPFSFGMGFVLSQGLALLGTGIVGAIATGFAGAFLLAYMLLGLAVLHMISRRSPFRTVLLTVLYAILILQSWVALVLAVLGLSEPVLQLRKKFTGQPPAGTGRT